MFHRPLLTNRFRFRTIKFWRGPLNSGKKFTFLLALFGLFVFSACASPPVALDYEPAANQVQPKQYVSSLNFGFVTFEDDRMIPKGTGVKRMIGWGQPDTFIADKDIPQHVTRAFVRQYRYLGFHSTWIKTPPESLPIRVNSRFLPLAGEANGLAPNVAPCHPTKRRSMTNGDNQGFMRRLLSPSCHPDKGKKGIKPETRDDTRIII